MSHKSGPNHVNQKSVDKDRIGFFDRMPLSIQLAVLGAVTLGAIASGCSDRVDATPVTTEITTPGPDTTTDSEFEITTTTEKSGEVIVEGLDAELMDNPEELMNAYFNLLTQWYNAGATIENANAAFDFVREGKGTLEDYANQLAAEYDGPFMAVLLPGNWQSDPGLKESVQGIISTHANTVWMYIISVGKGATPYNRGIELVGIRSSGTTTGGKVVCDYRGIDNDTDSQVGANGETIDKSVHGAGFTFALKNGEVLWVDINEQ